VSGRRRPYQPVAGREGETARPFFGRALFCPQK